MMKVKRDSEILRLLGDFGYCNITHIQKLFDLRKQRSYKVMQRLMKMGLVIHEHVLHRGHGVYRLSKDGSKYIAVPYLKEISLCGYKHQLMVIDVYIKLKALHPEATWLSERILKLDKSGYRRARESSHIADGVLVFPEGKKIAVEVELTMKGKDRLKKILGYYITEFSIDEVWYYCHTSIIKKMMKAAEGSLNIRFFKLEDLSQSKL